MATDNRTVIVTGMADGFTAPESEIEVTFNHIKIFDGIINTSDYSPWGGYKLATINNLQFDADNDPEQLYTVKPVEILVRKGTVFLEAWLWNYFPFAMNPALSAEEQAIFEQGTEAIKNAPEQMKNDVQMRGGWYVSDPDQYWTGLFDDVKSVRLDCKVNGVLYEFDPDHPDNPDDYEDRGISVIAHEGDVVTWTQLIPKRPL
jgi:hypothetical protein